MPFVDVDLMEELVPKIVDVLKSVNLGSRVASADFIILLALHLGKSMEPFTGNSKIKNLEFYTPYLIFLRKNFSGVG